VLRADPGHSHAWNCRGIAYAQKGELELAVLDFTTAIELRPGFGPYYRNRALAYSRKGEQERARRDARRARELGCQLDLERMDGFPYAGDGGGK
jgi:Flp pilus assembly protein TadD